jgi:hypothetical protein
MIISKVIDRRQRLPRPTAKGLRGAAEQQRRSSRRASPSILIAQAPLIAERSLPLSACRLDRDVSQGFLRGRPFGPAPASGATLFGPAKNPRIAVCLDRASERVVSLR